MRRYELMLLLRPDLEDDKLQAAVEKVTRAVVNGGGSLSKVSPWGKRRLAYDIGQHREASYFLIHFDIEPSQVREIERGMLISEEILRHLVTVLEDRGVTDEELAPAATPRGEELAVGEAIPFAPEESAVALEEPPVAADDGADLATSDVASADNEPIEAVAEEAPAVEEADDEPADEDRAAG